MDGGRSRRAFLRTTVTAVAGLNAGCLGRLGRERVVDVDGGPDPTAFSQFRGGLHRRGAHPEVTIPLDPSVAWVDRQLNTGEHTAAKASPVATPVGDVVVPGDAGIVRRYKPDGKLVWEADVEPANRGIHGTPAIANGAVYVGAYDGAFYAFDLETGARYWRSKLGDAIGSSPGYHDGTVFIAVEYRGPDGSMFALDAVTGKTEWVDRRPTNHPHSTCAIDRSAGRLVVGANDGTLYGWSYPDLEFEWAFETGRPIKGPIATGDGLAFFGSWDRTVYAVDLADGTEHWSFSPDGLVMTGPTVERATETVYVGSHDGRLYALDLASGDERWRFETGGALIGCPTATRDHVLVGSYDGHLYAIRKRTGEKRWRVAGVGRVTSTPLVLDGAVYFTDRASKAHLEDEGGPTGGLYKIGPADG